MHDLTFAFLLLAARKRASRVWKAQLITELISVQLFLYIVLNFCSIFTHGIYIKPTTPKLTAAVFKLEIAKLLIEH